MEIDTLLLVDSALRGGAACALLLTALIFLRDGLASPPARLGALFAIGVIGYLICSSPWFMQLPQPVILLVLFFCFVNPVLFWLFGRALFVDGFKPAATDLALVLIIAAIGYTNFLSGDGLTQPISNVITVVMQLVSIGIVAHLFALALMGRKDDLIEARRRFRLIFVAGIGVYVLIIASAELVFLGGEAPQDLETLNVAGIALVSIILAASQVRLRADDLLGSLLRPAMPTAPAAHREQGNKDDRNDRDDPLAKALNKAMGEDKAYTTEAFSIGTLAERLSVPEYRLRRLINQQLGYRNFTAFLNHYRLADAKTALADPARARTPVLTIALELGYGSIGPFNRAFKADTGMTPTEFRKQKIS